MTSNALYCEQIGVETFLHPNKADKAEMDYSLFNYIGRLVLSPYTCIGIGTG